MTALETRSLKWIPLALPPIRVKGHFIEISTALFRLMVRCMSALIRSRRNTQERKETLLILLQQYCGGLLYFTEKGQILSSAFEVKHCRESWDVLDL